VVKRIFDLIASGFGMARVANLLNDEGVEAPSRYTAETRAKLLAEGKRVVEGWCISSIRELLNPACTSVRCSPSVAPDPGVRPGHARAAQGTQGQDRGRQHDPGADRRGASDRDAGPVGARPCQDREGAGGIRRARFRGQGEQHQGALPAVVGRELRRLRLAATCAPARSQRPTRVRLLGAVRARPGHLLEHDGRPRPGPPPRRRHGDAGDVQRRGPARPPGLALQ
jgi:hypothetical protein